MRWFGSQRVRKMHNPFLTLRLSSELLYLILTHPFLDKASENRLQQRAGKPGICSRVVYGQQPLHPAATPGDLQEVTSVDRIFAVWFKWFLPEMNS